VDLDQVEGKDDSRPQSRVEEEEEGQHVVVHHFDPKLHSFVLEQQSQPQVDSEEFDYGATEEEGGSPVLPHPAHHHPRPVVVPVLEASGARPLDLEQHLTSLPEDLYQVRQMKKLYFYRMNETYLLV
jgi:hypothetical protein